MYSISHVLIIFWHIYRWFCGLYIQRIHLSYFSLIYLIWWCWIHKILYIWYLYQLFLYFHNTHTHTHTHNLIHFEADIAYLSHFTFKTNTGVKYNKRMLSGCTKILLWTGWVIVMMCHGVFVMLHTKSGHILKCLHLHRFVKRHYPQDNTTTIRSRSQ